MLNIRGSALRRVALVAGIAAATAVGATGAADARTLDEARAVCPDTFCGFKHVNFGGSYFPMGDGDRIDRLGRRNDEMSSFFNEDEDGVTMCLYEHELLNYLGFDAFLPWPLGSHDTSPETLVVAPGQSDASLVDNGWNDRVSSVRSGRHGVSRPC